VIFADSKAIGIKRRPSGRLSKKVIMDKYIFNTLVILSRGRLSKKVIMDKYIFNTLVILSLY